MHICMVCKTWGSLCGIAEHVRDLTEGLRACGVPVEVATHLDRVPADTTSVHLHHEYSLYPMNEVHSLARQVKENRVPLVVTLHSVTGEGWAKQHHRELAGNAHLVVQSEGAFHSLVADGVPPDRLALMPQGCPSFPDSLPSRHELREACGLPQDRFVVGCFGFLGRHKGLEPLCRAVLALPWAVGMLRLNQHFLSGAMTLEQLCSTLGIAPRPAEPTVWQNLMVYRQPLPIPEVWRWMSAADVNVLPYDDGPVYGSSSAARLLLATGRPLVTTRTDWFSDLDGVALQIPSIDREPGLRTALEQLRADPALLDDLAERSRRFAERHTWPKVAANYAALYAAVQGE